MNKWDARTLLFLMACTFLMVVRKELVATVGLGLLSLSWATAMSKH